LHPRLAPQARASSLFTQCLEASTNQENSKEENVVKKRLKTEKNSTRRFRRLPLLALIVAATSVAAIAAVTVISRQQAEVKSESNAQANKTVSVKAAPAANKTYVTLKVAGQDVQIDGQTGQMKPLSPEEAQKLAAGLKQEINQTTDGLVQKQEPDGSVTMDLNGHFQDVVVARKNEDGTVSNACVDNPKAAGAFFGIDPQLIDRQATKGATGQQRQPARPVNNENQ
jgi:hypothetical protein